MKQAILRPIVAAFFLDFLLSYFPKLHRLVVCCQQKHIAPVLFQPMESVYFVVDVRAFQVVKLFLMRLDFGDVLIVRLVLFVLNLIFKENHSACSVAYSN